MCLIVDANSFSHVFNPKDKKHAEFAPVLEWLFHGHGGGLIYGGKKYKKEVRFGSLNYNPLLLELQRKGRLFEICDECVDELAARLKQKVPDPVFNDEHILALVIISKCRVVCTDDMESVPFLRERSLYPKGVLPPKIYRSKRNANLCRNSDHIADVCKSKTGLCRNIHKQ